VALLPEKASLIVQLDDLSVSKILSVSRTPPPVIHFSK